MTVSRVHPRAPLIPQRVLQSKATWFVFSGALASQVPLSIPPPHLFLEAHDGNVASHTSILLMIAALRLCVEFAVYDGLLGPCALDLVEVDGPYP